MNHLISHIEYLIMRHDCVVVPGWGAFVARRRPACYDDVAQRFVAPRRELSFNPEIVHADGLVASSISRKEGVSFEQASIIIARETEAMKSQLMADGELSLGRIGRFIAQSDASPLFEASQRMERSMSSLFPSLDIKTIAAKIEQERRDAQAQQLRPRRSRMKRFGLKAVKAAASVVVVAGIAIGLIAPIVNGRDDRLASVSATTSTFVPNSQTAIVAPASGNPELLISVPSASLSGKSANGSLSDVSVSYEVVDRIPAPVATASVTHAKEATTLPAAKPVAAPSADKATTTPQALKSMAVERDENVAGAVRFNESDPYCLIVASLPTREGAEKYMRETKGNFGVLEQDGKFRVYVATGSTSSSTIAMRSGDIASRFPDAWVCRRK